MLMNHVNVLNEDARRKLVEIRKHLSSCPDLNQIVTADQVENEELRYHGDATRAALEYVEYLLEEECPVSQIPQPSLIGG